MFIEIAARPGRSGDRQLLADGCVRFGCIESRAVPTLPHTDVATIAFDIEVAGLPWEEVDDPTREYLLSKAGDAEAREGIPNRTALFPGLGKVIAIGLWLVEQNRGLMLLEGESQPERAWDRVPATKIFRGSEQEILAHFWNVVAKRGPCSRPSRLVTYNGRTYDGPTLMIRSAQLGVRVSRHLVPYRRRRRALVTIQTRSIPAFLTARKT